MCKIFQKIDEIVRRFVYWIAFFGLVWAFMSWVATHITWVSKYGWGAVVFAGVGAACVVMLVVSGALVALRYFNPLPGQSNTDESLERDSIKSNRRALIAEARDFVSRTVRQNPDSSHFERQLASDPIFYKLRPYFSDHFKMTLSGRMVSYPSWEDSRMPVIAARFIDEIERLEKTWDLT
jgi:hypothetical protein